MSNLKRNSLIYNFSSLGIIQVVNFLLSLIVIPHVIRKVGVEGFGVVAVAQVAMYYMANITEYGFNQTATRSVSLNKEDKLSISRIFFTVIACRIILLLFSFLLLVILIVTVPLFREHASLYLLGFVFVAGQGVLVNWFFQGFERMHFVAIAGLFARLLFVVLVLIFIQNKSDNRYYLFFMGIGTFLSGLISIFAAIRIWKLRFILPAWSHIRDEIREGWRITITNLSMTTCQYIGIFILRVFTNDLLVGYYSIAEKIYFGMKMMLDVFSQTIYPRVCQVFQKGTDYVFRFYRQVYLPFFLLVTIAATGVAIFSPAILRFFLGDQHAYSAFLLRMLCIPVVIVCLNIPAYLILLAADQKKIYFKVFTIGMVINITANIILAQSFDAKGTVIAVLITEFFITTVLWLAIYRMYPVKRQVGDRQ